MLLPVFVGGIIEVLGQERSFTYFVSKALHLRASVKKIIKNPRSGGYRHGGACCDYARYCMNTTCWKQVLHLIGM